MDCPICSHPKKDDIDEGLTMGVDFDKLARRYNVSSDDIVQHWRHGLAEDDNGLNEEAINKLTSTSTDIYSILRHKLRHLKKRFDSLTAATAATGESRELIQLSKAIDDTITVQLKVAKEMGIVEETRIVELEKMISEIMMVMPKMCKKDQQLLDSVLGLESVEV